MTYSKIFKINELVDLRLKRNKTYIYVNNKKFLTCIRLFLNIPSNRIHETKEIKSVDEAAELFKQTLLRNKIIDEPGARIYRNHTISPEEEFGGHCSNIQAFFENGLNTDLLASNIAFPLLKKLVDLGYKPAVRVFKEEIVKRYNEGTHNSRLFLKNEGYLNYLNEEEKQVLKENNTYLLKQYLRQSNTYLLKQSLLNEEFRENLERFESLQRLLKDMRMFEIYDFETQKIRIREKQTYRFKKRECEICNDRFFGKYPKIVTYTFKLCPKCFDDIIQDIENIFDDS